MEWLIENIKWIFSGIGVTVVLGIIGVFTQRNKAKQQIINAGRDSTNIQSGRDVNVTFGEKNDG